MLSLYMERSRVLYVCLALISGAVFHVGKQHVYRQGQHSRHRYQISFEKYTYKKVTLLQGFSAIRIPKSLNRAHASRQGDSIGQCNNSRNASLYLLRAFQQSALVGYRIHTTNLRYTSCAIDQAYTILERHVKTKNVWGIIVCSVFW